LHYRIWHSDILRRRISWTLTSKFKLVFAVVFALIHYCIMLSCVVVSGTTSTRSPECLPGLDVYYLLALLVSFVSFTAYLVSRIPLRFDAFGIVTEFQLCLWCWSLLGGAALALLAISSHGYSIERELFSLTHSILQLIMNMASFYISIVRPTWEVRKLIIKQEFGANLLNRTHALYMTPELGKGTDRRKHYLHTGMTDSEVLISHRNLPQIAPRVQYLGSKAWNPSSWTRWPPRSCATLLKRDSCWRTRSSSRLCTSTE